MARLLTLQIHDDAVEIFANLLLMSFGASSTTLGETMDNASAWLTALTVDKKFKWVGFAVAVRHFNTPFKKNKCAYMDTLTGHGKI